MSGRVAHALERVGLEIAQVFNDGDINDAKDTLRECLMASRTVRSGRDAGGHIVYSEVPDYPIRLAAGIKILEWSIGRPVSRTIVADATPKAATNEKNAQDELLNLLLAAPDAATDIIAKLQEAARKHQNGKPVEITVTPSLPENQKPSS